MQKLIHHINRVKEQPHHIRRQVALTVALGIAVLIGFVWLVGSLAMGSFAIKGSNFAQSVGTEPAASGNDSDATSQLAGVGAAADSSNASAPHIQIIDASTSTAPQPEQTVIPF